ncbi:MAG: IS1182 family transposase [candidate division WOR-3 bacterium]|nr:IS1182 family transposase [candidate division WOR-3 bacterium]
MPVRSYNQNQLFLLPPSLNEWVKSDHPTRVLSEIIDHLDVSGFRDEKTEGRPCYDTRMMLKILLWGYACGARASRKIEERLYSDVIFMWLAGLEKPDFRTICLFRRCNLEAISQLFAQVITLAKGLGMLRLGLIALDGTKVRANAGIGSFKKVAEWHKELAEAKEEVRRILQEAEALDQADDEKFGSANRGDELPEELTKTEQRMKKIEELMDKIGEDASAKRLVSSTDPDASYMHNSIGSIPAYNAQVAVTEDQLIVYADVSTEPVDTNQLKPALDGIQQICSAKPEKVVADTGFNSNKNLGLLEEQEVDGYIPESGEKNIGKVLRNHPELYSKDDFEYDAEHDCYRCPAGKLLLARTKGILKSRYSKKAVTVYRTEPGICLSCAKKNKCTETKNKVGRSITRCAYEVERKRMRQKLKTETGRTIYGRRKCITEPVIGQLKVVGRFVQFLLRGIMGVRIEWKWATTAHNLLKIARWAMTGDVKLALKL